METYGKFELLTCLARGGMAEVFIARQRGEGRFERLVVIKRILPQFADDRRFIELFLEEARIAALLDHPNVIPIYDLGRVEDSFFIAMPYVHGITVQGMLKEASRRRVPLPFAVSVEIARQSLAGLHYAHERIGLDGRPMRLVHRDVSPSNLMINEQGRTQLLDFGIASVADSAAEETGSLRGKLAYMSPEQVRAAPLDRRSDLFSLGVVLYELLVGKRLFQRRADVQVIDAITRDPLPDPCEQRPDLPAALGDLVLQALQREPSLRFATAAQMSAALLEAHPAAGQQGLGRFVQSNFSETLAAQQDRLRRAQDGVLSGEAPTRVDRPRPSTRRPARGRRGLRVLVPVLVLLALAAAGVTWFLLGTGPSGKPLTFGVIPFLPEDLLRREWEPLRRYLEREVDRPVQLQTTLSYGQMVDALIQGEVDVADLSAYPYLLARRRDPGIHVLATGITDRTATYEGYLVTRRSASARGIPDLRGKRVCYVDRTSTSGYLMPRVMVRRAGFDPDRFFASYQFSGDHYRALRDLLAERCDVACVGSSSFATAERQGIPVRTLRILASSPPLPHGVYVASSRLPDLLVDRLRRALLHFDVEQELGRPRLGQHMQITGFAQVDPAAFDELEREVRRSLPPDASPTVRDGQGDVAPR